MKIIIAGSREIENYRIVKSLIEDSDFNIKTVISGTARGVDRLGERWALENNIPIERYPAEWDKYGKSAGPIRNNIMAEKGDGLIAIKIPESRGTAHMISAMKALGKPVEAYVLKKVVKRVQEILMFSKPSCSYCESAKAFLKDKNIPFTEKNIIDPENRAKLFEMLPGVKTVPQFFFLNNNEYLGNYDKLLEYINAK